MTTHNSPLTSTLLTAGIIAGPFFIIVALLQAFTRAGFDLVRHPASLLSLGDLGWIQIANFVITGLFFIACAIGLARAPMRGIGHKWAPRLLVVLGIGLIMGGVFVADAGLGFPPGAPEGVPATMSWHGTIHAFAPLIGFTAHVAVLFILARRFGKQGERGLMWITIIVGVVMFGLANVPNFTADWENGQFNFLPLWAAVLIGYTVTAFVLAKLKAEWQAGKWSPEG
jgi:hypothetical protein